MGEILITVALTTVLVALVLWVYQSKKDTAVQLDDIRGDFTDFQIAVNEALHESAGKIGGYKDHITGMRSDIDLMEKTLAEAISQLDSDELSRIKDRLGFCELASGIRRGDKAKVS